MSTALLQRLFPQPASPFLLAAREHGLRNRVARTLEPAAREYAPGEPQRIFQSRVDFEEVAMRAVVGDAGNLELSFRLVDQLANALEALGLARSSDVPDPFRRVWVENGAGGRTRGVVLRCADGEVAVFCPPSRSSIGDIGCKLRLNYRSFNSSVGYDLQLNDSVRLPGAQVLHLTRLEGKGSIGRSANRYEVSMEATVRPFGTLNEEEQHTFTPCVVIDISVGGLKFESTSSFESEQMLCLALPLPDGTKDPVELVGITRFIANSEDGKQRVSFQFQGVEPAILERLGSYLETLEAGD